MILSAKPSPKRVILEIVALLAVVALGLALEDSITITQFRAIIAVEAIVATIAAWSFVAYFSRSAWRRSVATRAIMGLMVAFSCYLTLAIIGLWLPPFRGETALRLVVYSGVLYAICRLLVTLRREQILATRLRNRSSQTRTAGGTS